MPFCSGVKYTQKDWVRLEVRYYPLLVCYNSSYKTDDRKMDLDFLIYIYTSPENTDQIEVTGKGQTTVT